MLHTALVLISKYLFFRVKVTETLTDTGLKNVIDISYAEGRDAGVYECRASNPYGVAEHYFYLNILGKKNKS